MAEKPLAVCLLGPTASGKSALALQLCERYPFEIVSVDSAQVYRGLDIGSAKPDAAEQALVRHHLLDIRDPAEPYSAAEFRVDALRAMADITARGRIPLLVGGTMLYFKVLREGLAPLPAADPALRRAIEEEAAAKGWPALHAELARRDAEAAARIHPNHSRRIQRALEVCRLSGEPMSELLRRADTRPLSHRLLQMALAPTDRALLHQRIAVRFRAMLQGGLIDEVEALYRRGDLSPELPSIRSVGYRQVWSCLAGEVAESQLEELGIAATRQLAKRQYTWLRQWPQLHWLRFAESEAAQQEAMEIACSFIDEASI